MFHLVDDDNKKSEPDAGTNPDEGEDFSDTINQDSVSYPITQPLEFDTDDDPDEYQLTITRRTTGIGILSIHIACFLSRALVEVSDGSLASILSQVSWLIYATTVPGLLILLNRRLGALRNYDVIFILPLSLMWVMIIAPVVQVLGFIFSILNPITWFATGYLSLLGTLILYYRYSLRNRREFSLDLRLKLPSLTVVLSCITMVAISIIGPLWFNQTGDNYASMVAILLISLLPVFMSVDSKFGRYLLLYSTSLSALLVVSLVSPNVAGMDIQLEYHFSNKVIENGNIDLFSSNHYSTVISTQGLVPLITIWTSLPLTTVLKLVYPIVFSFSSVLLFYSYSRIFDEETSYFATLLVIFTVSYYTSMLDVVRQGLSEIFMLSAIALVCSSEDFRSHRNRIFLIPFLISMSLAHYGVNYVLYPVFWIAYGFFISYKFFRPFSLATDSNLIVDQSASESLSEEEDEIQTLLEVESTFLEEGDLVSMEELQDLTIRGNPLLNIFHLTTGTVFFLSWHTFSASGAVIETVTLLWRSLVNLYEKYGIWGAFTKTQTSQFVATTLEPFHELTKYLYMLILALSLPSVLTYLSDSDQDRSTRNFLSLTIGSMLFLAAAFLIPKVALSLHFARIFHILTLFVFPFSVLTVLEANSYLSRFGIVQERIDWKTANSIMVSSLFLLSSGFVYQLTDESHRMNLDDDVDWASFSESEEAGSFWRSNYAPDPSSGLPCEAADFYRAKILHKHLLSPVPSNPNSVLNSQFVFISGNNINEGTFFFSTTNSEHEYALTEFITLESHFSEQQKDASVIYDSGEARWYHFLSCKV